MVAMIIFGLWRQVVADFNAACCQTRQYCDVMGCSSTDLAEKGSETADYLTPTPTVRRAPVFL